MPDFRCVTHVIVWRKGLFTSALSPQDGATVEAQRMATNVWRLTAGRPNMDGRNSTVGRLDFVLQVMVRYHTCL